MIKTIKELYRTLGDATIDRLDYRMTTKNLGGGDRILLIYINCFNWTTEQWDQIVIECKTVTKLRFLETKKNQSAVIFEALLEEKANGIILDFFPIQEDGLGKLKEDANSNFVVHCQQVKFTVI